MSKRYSGKSFKDSSVMKKAKFSLKEKRKIDDNTINTLNLRADIETKKFEDEDIDTILSKRADVKAIGSKKGNAFSTFTFDAREEEDKEKFDNVDPAEYWKTMFPDAARKAEEEKKDRKFVDERLIVYGRRNRVNNFGTNLNLSLLESEQTRGRRMNKDGDFDYIPSREKRRDATPNRPVLTRENLNRLR